MNILAAHQKKNFFKATRMKNLNEPVLSPCKREPEINRACFKEIDQLKHFPAYERYACLQFKHNVHIRMILSASLFCGCCDIKGLQFHTVYRVDFHSFCLYIVTYFFDFSKWNPETPLKVQLFYFTAWLHFVFLCFSEDILIYFHLALRQLNASIQTLTSLFSLI